MKKVLTLVAFAGMMAFVACGPSEAEKAAKEKAKQDSIALAEKAKATQDSIVKATAEKAKQDSIAKVAEAAKQDSIAKAAEKAPKKGKK